MNSEESELNLLKKQVGKLQLDLSKKDNEIDGYLEKIQNVEDELLDFHEIMEKSSSDEDILNLFETKYKFEMKEKEREIRDLKNRMGFLRQDKIAFQRELDDLKKKSNTSSISVEEVREKYKLLEKVSKLETLTKELQEKHNSQERMSINLMREMNLKDEQIKELTAEDKELKEKVERLNQELEYKNSLLERKGNKAIKKEVSKGHKKDIDKSKKEIEALRKKLAEYKKPEIEKAKSNIDIIDLKNQIKHLKEELKSKDKLIKDLKSNK